MFESVGVCIERQADSFLELLDMFLEPLFAIHEEEIYIQEQGVLI